MSESTVHLEPDIPGGPADPVEPPVSLEVLAELLPGEAEPACPRCQTDLSHVASAAR